MTTQGHKPTRTPNTALWARQAVVYQVYPRSFQDSDGDGVGDLPGVTARLEHLAWLGVDAVWLSPFYPSPLADYGYDVADYTDVADEYGTLADFDRLVERAHELGLRVVLDLVPSHTSIEHPWFRDHPDRYVIADGPDPPNNWVAAFGGPAWSRDPESGRLYLHSFFPEQPDLDWRNPEVAAAMGEVVRFWLDRGADGFRVDAVERMVKDPELRSDPDATKPFPLPLHPAAMALRPLYSRNHPDIELALGALREAAGDAPLFGEVYLPADSLEIYLRNLDSVFAFDLLHASWDARSIGRAVERSAGAGAVSWVVSNHDFSRVATRWGEENARAAAVLLLTLGGTAFVYQGEEIGMVDGRPPVPPRDRFGRDAERTPMQWEGEMGGGFTEGPAPWLPLVDPLERNVDDQRGDPDSVLNLFRGLIELRKRMDGTPRLLDSPPEIVFYERGRHRCAINFAAEPMCMPISGDTEIAIASSSGAASAAAGLLELEPHAAAVLIRTREVSP